MTSNGFKHNHIVSTEKMAAVLSAILIIITSVFALTTPQRTVSASESSSYANYAVYSATDNSLTFLYSETTPSGTIKAADGVTDITVTAVYSAGDGSGDTGWADTKYTASRVPWASYRTRLASVEFRDITAPLSTGSWFYQSGRLTSINFSNLDTSNTVSMVNMFYQCTNLTTLNLSSFDTSNVENMGYMFYGCSKLTSLDLSNFDTSNATTMANMFYGCSKLTSLDLSNFDTSNVTDMQSMFSGCTNLGSLDISRFDTSSVTSMAQMFRSCSKLTTIYVLKDFDTTSLSTSSGMFSGCSNLKGGNGTAHSYRYVTAARAVIDTPSTPGYFTKTLTANYAVYSATDNSLTFLYSETTPSGTIKAADGVTDIAVTAAYPKENGQTGFDDWGLVGDGTTITTPAWYSDIPVRNSIETVEFRTMTVPTVSTSGWFQNMSNLTEILDLYKLYTSDVVNMANMFGSASSLASLNLSWFDTSQVSNMSGMFYGCSTLSSLDLSGFDTSNVLDMQSLFENDSALEELDISGFSTSSSTLDALMFSGCSSLKSITLGEGFAFNDSILPTPSSASPYTGLWSYDSPYSQTRTSSATLKSDYPSAIYPAGTYVWAEEIPDFAVNFYSNISDTTTAYVAEQIISYGSTVSAPATNPTRTGYTFAGWATTPSGTAAATFPYTISADTDFYAIWIVNTFPVNFYSNISDTTTTYVPEQTIAEGSTVSAPAVDPTRTGYVFSGWATSPSSTTAETFPYTVSSATDFYAIWTSGCTVNFYANISDTTTTYVPEQTIAEGSTVSAPSTDPTRPGYVFSGWATTPSGTAAAAFPYTVSADTDFYAIWTPGYTVNFYSNISDTTTAYVAEQTIAAGSSVSAPATDPTRSGYVFSGWATTPSGTAAATFPYTISADTDFYAIWTPGYTVNFYSNISDTTTTYVPEQTVSYGAIISQPAINPTNPGYVFVGWASSPSSDVIEVFPQTIQSDKSYYAIWQPAPVETGRLGDITPFVLALTVPNILAVIYYVNRRRDEEHSYF